MCGILGFVGAARPEREQIDAFAQCLRHRGPDSQDVLYTGEASLVHTRLSILDLSEAGRQPMPNEDESLWLVFNGEIYNAPALREELLEKGHRFRSETDSEVLLHLYEEEGTQMVRRLRGMFAFALYEPARRELFLARDPFGIKPLFYADWSGDGFGFASELKGLLAHPDFSRQMDWEALSLYLQLRYVPAPWTMWEQARRLKPGHRMLVREGRVVEKEPYFDLDGDPWEGSREEAVAALDQVLRESVRRHLLSDVPVGAFLSGGLDSSLVTALAQQEADESLRTFTIAFPGVGAQNEADHARRVADHVGTSHEEIPVTAEEGADAMLDMLDHLDEPFADASLIPTSIVSKLTGREVKVALAGDGGDELFAGYGRYQGLRVAKYLHRAGPLLRAAATLPFPESRDSPAAKWWLKFRKLARISSGGTPFERFARATARGEEAGLSTLSREARSHMRDGELMRGQLRSLWERGAEKGFEEGDRWLYTDARFGLSYDMLQKVDTASMRYSLEVRVPLVDPVVAQFAFRLPPGWKLRWGQRKWLLKKVAERYLPRDIIHKPKQGFEVPLGEWIRSSKVRDTFQDELSPRAMRQSPVWDEAHVRGLFEEHFSRRRDNMEELWSILVFEKWRQKWSPRF